MVIKFQNELYVVSNAARICAIEFTDGRHAIAVCYLSQYVSNRYFVVNGGEAEAIRIINEIFNTVASGSNTYEMPETVYEVETD